MRESHSEGGGAQTGRSTVMETQYTATTRSSRREGAQECETGRGSAAQERHRVERERAALRTLESEHAIEFDSREEAAGDRSRGEEQRGR